MSFLGYERENGTVGVRNHVAIISVDALSGPVTEGISRIVRHTVPICHPYGRLQFGEDLDLTFNTLIGTGANPNVAAALVVGLEPVWTRRVVEGIAKTRKPVDSVTIVGKGDLKAIEQGAKIVRRMVSAASELKREEFPISSLVLSMKCGASDTTSGIAANPTVQKAATRVLDEEGTVLFGETSELAGAEHLIAARAADKNIGEMFLKTFKEYLEFATSKGVDILGSQPTQENIAGGLSTIEEKALGNIQKVPQKPIRGILKPTEKPPGKGLYFMDTSSSAQEAVTLFAAAGAQVHMFPTGQGNVVGHPIEPVMKISGNQVTVTTMEENIDLDVSGILSGELTVEKAGEMLYSEMLKVASGKLTAAEILGHSEFALTRLYKSM